MPGRDLIMQILENHLEDEPVFQNGTFVGYVSDMKFAEIVGVGVATVRAWIMMGRIKDTIMIGDAMFISTIYINTLKSEVKHESEIE